MKVLKLYSFPPLFSHIQGEEKKNKSRFGNCLHFTGRVCPNLHFWFLVTPYLVITLFTVVIKQNKPPPWKVHKHKMKHHEHHLDSKVQCSIAVCHWMWNGPFYRRSEKSFQLFPPYLLVSVKRKKPLQLVLDWYSLKTKNHNSIIGSWMCVYSPTN